MPMDRPSVKHQPAKLVRRPRLVTAVPAKRSAEQDPQVTLTASFFICHTLRCGSTLLCDALSGTGVAGYAEEYFPERSSSGELYVATVAALRDPDTWECDWTSTPFQQCLDRVLGSGTTSNGVFAAKVKWPNIPCFSEMLGDLPEREHSKLAERLDPLFPNLRYVWVTRRDKVRQSVSLVKARQSAQWKAMSGEPQRSDTGDYNFHVIDMALRRIVSEECAWEEFFTRAGITPFTVVYEDLVRTFEPTVRRLLDDLGIALPTRYEFGDPRVKKQADATSEEWVERYHRDARASLARRTAVSVPALLVKRHLRETYVAPRVSACVRHLWGAAQIRIGPQTAGPDDRQTQAADAFRRTHALGPQAAPVPEIAPQRPADSQTKAGVAKPKCEADLGRSVRRSLDDRGRIRRRSRRIGSVLMVVILALVVSMASTSAGKAPRSGVAPALHTEVRFSDLCRESRAQYAVACVRHSFGEIRHRL